MINQQREMILIVVDNRENNWNRWKKTAGSFECAKHGTNLASESLATGFYRQV